MSQESTTPDLAERMRLLLEAADRADWVAVLTFVAPEAVWEANVDEARAAAERLAKERA